MKDQFPETFDYDFSDVLGWFDSLNGSVDIEPVREKRLRLMEHI